MNSPQEPRDYTPPQYPPITTARLIASCLQAEAAAEGRGWSDVAAVFRQLRHEHALLTSAERDALERLACQRRPS